MLDGKDFFVGPHRNTEELAHNAEAIPPRQKQMSAIIILIIHMYTYAAMHILYNINVYIYIYIHLYTDILAR